MKDKKLEFLQIEYEKVKDNYKSFEQFYSTKITDVLACYTCQTYFWLSEDKKCDCK